MPIWYEGEVIRIQNESPSTKRFWVQVLNVDRFDFQAGQFVTIDLPIGDKRLQRWRSYSIANAPDGGNVLEFCIVHLEGGIASRYLFNEITVGSLLRFKGPEGGFILPEPLNKDLVLLCTGTGVAPFRSMLHDIKNRQLSYKNIQLIFGTRYGNGLLYAEEFREMEQRMPGFSYSVALSKEENLPTADSGIEIRKGYIHQFYLEKYMQVRPDVLFYICGWTKMVDEAVANLLKLGYDRNQIRYELYG
jgi:CDP-4-dehydro-6-deoxyglucose reductase